MVSINSIRSLGFPKSTTAELTPSLLADLIIGVQPMKANTGGLFKLLKSRKTGNPPKPHNRSSRARRMRRVIALSVHQFSWGNNSAQLFVDRRRKRRSSHWRDLQLFPDSIENRTILNNLSSEFMLSSGSSEGIYSKQHSQVFWDWLAIEVAPMKARIAFDIVFQLKGIRFPDDVSLVAFLLKWGGAQP